jgi:hypothetical protein
MKTMYLVAGVVCAAIVCACVAPVLAGEDGQPGRDVLIRKARKYHLNPNLLESVITVEAASAKVRLDDPDVMEWISEQSARVLAHVMTRTEDLSLVLKLYATGGIDVEEPSDRQTIKFISEVRKAFRRLEKARPWDKKYPEEIISGTAKQ